MHVLTAHLSRLVCAVVVFGGLASPAAFAEDAVDGEVIRLQEQMDSLAQKNAWTGVERGFQDIVDLGLTPDRAHMLLAAEASRQAGDVLSTLQRLLEAQSMASSDDVQDRIDDIAATFGRVQLQGQAPLTISQMPFRPDAAAAVRYANGRARTDGTFDGFLPAGSFRFGDISFRVTAGQEVMLVSFEDPEQEAIEDITMAGVAFPRKVVVGGHKLVLNGVGSRSKLSINVYVAALYLTEPTSVAVEAVRQDLPKRFVMEFVFRKVSRTATVDHFRQAFERMKLADNVRADVERFLALIPDSVAGDRMTFDYVPGKGTTIHVKGKKRLTVHGKPFMWALFSVYLGDRPPTEKLKRGLLGQ